MKNAVPYLFVIGLFGLFACNNLLTRGMFMDGLIYTSVADNMANGIGSFWHPTYTATQFPDGIARYQFERMGYFCTDRDSTPDHLVFNRTSTLKDSWAKIKS